MTVTSALFSSKASLSMSSKYSNKLAENKSLSGLKFLTLSRNLKLFKYLSSTVLLCPQTELRSKSRCKLTKLFILTKVKVKVRRSYVACVVLHKLVHWHNFKQSNHKRRRRNEETLCYKIKLQHVCFIYFNRIFGTWTTLVILTKSTVGYSFLIFLLFFHNSINLDTEFDYNANLFL